MQRTSFLLLFGILSFSSCSGSGDGHRGIQTYVTALVQYQSCEALEADLKEMLIAEYDAQIEQMAHQRVLADGAPEMASGANTSDASGASGAGAAEAPRQEGTDFSGTNNQEDGVDEADFVKTDGYHIYVLNGNRFHMFGVPQYGQLTAESNLAVEGHPQQMLVNRGAKRVAIFSQIYAYNLPAGHPLRALVEKVSPSGHYYRSAEATKISILDIADPAAPRLVRELYLEGWYQTARMVKTSVRLASYSSMNIPYYYGDYYTSTGNEALDQANAKTKMHERIQSLTLADLLPQVYERGADGQMISHTLSTDACNSFYRPSNSHGRGVTSILSMDLSAAEFAFDADHIVTNYPTIYSSKNNLYVAEPANDWWWYWWNDDFSEQLNIHKFDIKEPGVSKYLGSGRVTGVLHNQFSLGENGDYLHVATTENRWNRWWMESSTATLSENHVFVLKLEGGEMVTTGHLGGIAEGERIFSARFVGDRGYVVTFRNTDPLFTLDLSDPTEPKIKGKLELPGFSSYIHPLEGEKLLTIGVGGDETNANWRTQISLFDVSDFTQPALQDKEELVPEGNWGWSEAQYEHKAFQYWAPKGLLAVPMSSYQQLSSTNGYWDYRYISRLELILVDPEVGLSRYGTIDHSHLFNSDSSRYWYYRDIRRSIFMGEFIYAISDRGLSVHQIADLAKVTEQSLPGYDPQETYWILGD